VFAVDKTVKHTRACFAGQMVPIPSSSSSSSSSGPWAPLAGITVQGYEIHHGQTQQHPAMAQAGDIAHAVMPGDLAWQSAQGNVLGVYLHGLFEDANVLHALFGAAAPTLDSVFDGLADYIEQHFEPGILQALIT